MTSATVTTLPVSTLLSQVLIALTIEFDNAFERRMPHRTTRYGPSAIGDGPWLVSQEMWTNFMRFIPEDGISIRELKLQSFASKEGLHMHMAGMKRWGYIVVKPDPSDVRPKPPQSDWIVRPTRFGRRAQAIWRPLLAEIEHRWRSRGDGTEIDSLRSALVSVVSRMHDALPEFLPVVGYGLFTEQPSKQERLPDCDGRDSAAVSSFSLSALLSQALMSFTVEFESEMGLSLPICANVLRILNTDGVPVRDLPSIACVSKEAISMSVGYLERTGYAADTEAGRGKTVRLTEKGQHARETYRQLVVDIEGRWRGRYGADEVGALRYSLEKLVGAPDEGPSRFLSLAIEPPAGNWRGMVRTPVGLPHHPMILHRGGYPDGS